MSQRRNRWYLPLALALLLAPFAIGQGPARAATQDYIVDTTDDNPFVAAQTFCNPSTAGDCSLRQAVGEAKRDGMDSLISFDVTGTINLDPGANGELVIDTPNLTIDADDPIDPLPVVRVDGAGAGYPAFKITTSNTVIKGLSITGFSGNLSPFGAGILIEGSSATSNTISLNHIGVLPNGTSASGNLYGVRILGGASGNVISGNFIGGNTIAGVSIENSSSNSVQSNGIGIGAGDSILRNGEAGVIILSTGNGASTANTIGGASSSLANTISGNGPGSGSAKAGILLQGAGTSANFIRANRLGLDAGSTATDGLTAVPNNGDGIRIESGASNNQIGGSNGAALVSSGNSGYGIRITGAGTSGNQISGGVFVGLNRTRNGAVANARGGIAIDNSAANTSITGSASALTLIAGNSASGVIINGAGTSGTQISNAYIGVVPDSANTNATLTFANAGGILLQNGAKQTTLSGNTISGNTGYGIRVTGAVTTTIASNAIGLDVARTAVVANGGPGIDVQSSSGASNSSRNTLIGGSGSAGNYIAGNTGPAVSISGTTTVSSTVGGNIIGLAKSLAADTLYLKAAGNGGAGVLVSNGPQQTVIGSNTIANSAGPGVQVAGVEATPTTTVTLSLNQIGWTVTAANNTAEKAQPNLGGVQISGASAVDLRSNSIKRNTNDGILVDGAARDVQVLSNTLTLNTGKGVKVAGNTQHVRIQYNRMSANAGGIELAGTSRKNGADTDTLALPNHGIDPPIDNLASPLRIRVSQDGKVEGWVYTDTNTIKRESTISPASACITCTIQFFRSADGASDGQGYTPIQIAGLDGGAAADFVTPNAQGFFTGQLVGGTPLPKQLLFVATDGYGNSSEFGALNVLPAFSLNYLAPGSGAQDAAPGQLITYTLSLSNSGSVDFNNLQFVTGGSLPRWTISPANGTSTFLTLRSGQSRTLTVTLKLPTGADTSVRYPISDTTTVTVTSSGLITTSKQLVTTVLATPVLSVDPSANVGSGPPSQQVPHAHRITNSGNVTVTLDLVAQTVDPADSGKIWATSFSQNPITLGPGLSADVLVRVTVPAGAQETNGQGAPVRATTFITATARVYPVTLTFSDTTGVDLVPDAVLDGGDEQQAASNEEIFFYHTVTNTSNGVARFKLNYTANSGSRVTFVTDNGVAIDPATNIFQLDSITDAATNKVNVLRFKAVVKVTDKLLPGDFERINIFLTNADSGDSIGGAAVIDSIQITASPNRPRVWMPFIAR